MRQGSFGPGMPLIWKELLQVGSRRQTYLVRMIYAALLFLAFLAFFAEFCVRPEDPLAVLGRGKDLFDFLVVFQFGAVYLFLPALVSGTIVEERQRERLHLLVLSRLRPWQILAGKLVGRTVPVVTLLLLSTPLLAIAYAYGGVSLDGFGLGIFFLGVACFQVGSVCLLASTFFRSPNSAFLGSYALTAAPAFAIPLFDFVALQAEFLTRKIGDTVSLVPLQLYIHTQAEPFLDGASRALPTLVSGLVCLALARLFLFRGAANGPRAEAPWNPLRPARWILARVRPGASLERETRTPPDTDEPVVWREMHRLGVASRRHQLIFALLLEALVVSIAALLMRGSSAPATGDIDVLSDLVVSLWILAILFASAVGVNAFIGESSRQTLDLLLATPLDGDELVYQKHLGIQRFLRVLCVPFATVFLIELILEFRGRPFTTERVIQMAVYSISSALSLAVFLPSAAWVAMWVGLRSKNAVRALLGTLLAVAALFLAPTGLWVLGWAARRWHDHIVFGAVLKALGICILLSLLLSLFFGSITAFVSLLLGSVGMFQGGGVDTWVFFISPTSAILATEYLLSWTGPLSGQVTLAVGIALNLLIHLAIYQRVRARCLRGADGYFGRM